jgi:uncharacterized protein
MILVKWSRYFVKSSLAQVLAGCFLLSGCAAFDAQQRSAIYRPSFAVATQFKGMASNDEVVFVSSLSGARALGSRSDYARKPDELGNDVNSWISLWWLPSAKPGAATVFYCHGVFRNLSNNYEKLNAIRSAGFNVLAVTYRGWPGTSALLPSENSIYEDATRGFAELALREPDPKKRIIYGHSMGGGVAVELASRLKPYTDYAALVLESTFTSMPEVAAQVRWYGFLLAPFASQQFRSVDKLRNISVPILFRHGDADTTIPIVLGERLFAKASEPKRFVVFKGGSHSGLHNESPQLYAESLQRFWQDYSEKVIRSVQ